MDHRSVAKPKHRKVPKTAKKGSKVYQIEMEVRELAQRKTKKLRCPMKVPKNATKPKKEPWNKKRETQIKTGAENGILKRKP